jgi:hypothetical protein
MALNAHRSNSYIPENIEVRDVATLSASHVRELIALSAEEVRRALEELESRGPEKVFVLPFSALMPDRAADAMDGPAYERLVKRYAAADGHDDSILSHRIAGAVSGERRLATGTGMSIFRINGMYAAPLVDQDHLFRHMLSHVKGQIGALDIDEIRVLVSPEEENAQGEVNWFWMEGFAEVKFSKKEKSHILAWDPLVSKARKRDRFPKAG